MKIPKSLNWWRAHKFYNRGWAELGKIIANRDNDAKMAQHVKRSNWIHNLCCKGEMFKGTI